MKKINYAFFLLAVALLSIQSCKKDSEPAPSEELPLVPQEFRILGGGLLNNSDYYTPVLWKANSRETDFISTVPNSHYSMMFMQKVAGKWCYFGNEDLNSRPSSRKLCMWVNGTKKVLAAETGFSTTLESVLNYYIDKTTNAIYILTASSSGPSLSYYYYKIENGTAISRHELPLPSGATEDTHPAYIQANGNDLHILFTEYLSDENKTRIYHYKNKTLYSTYVITTPPASDNTQYLYNEIRLIGYTTIQNDVVHLIGHASSSIEYYYLKLSKASPDNPVPVKLNIDYEIKSGGMRGGLFTDNKFYVPGDDISANTPPCYFIVNVQTATPTIEKINLQRLSGQSQWCYTNTVIKIGQDIYVTGTYGGDNGSVTKPCYWKNGSMINVDATGLSNAYISDIQFQ